MAAEPNQNILRKKICKNMTVSRLMTVHGLNDEIGGNVTKGPELFGLVLVEMGRVG